MKNTITLSQLQEVERVLKQDGYIKKTSNNGTKLKWSKEFDKFVLSVIFKESRDERNNRIIRFFYRAKYNEFDIKVEIKLPELDMDLAKQRFDEIYLTIEY